MIWSPSDECRSPKLSSQDVTTRILRSLGQLGLWSLVLTSGGLGSWTTRAWGQLPQPPDVPAFDANGTSPLVPGTAPNPQPPTVPTAPPPAPAPFVDVDPNYEPGSDLRQLVKLFINESLNAGNQAAAVNYNDLYDQLLIRSYGNDIPLISLEYQLIAETLAQYGDPADRFLSAAEFNQFLNQPRPPISATAVTPRVMYLRVPDLSASTTQEIRQALFAQDFSQGIILDLRGATGYDPQVIATVSRLFLPPSIAPLVVTEDRFDQLTEWDSEDPALAADVPLAVLIDRGTRQGAVLLAANLARSGRTITLGETTQGSERQTRFFLLPSGAAVELAVARWQSGENRPLLNGLAPMQPISGTNNQWIAAALAALELPPRSATGPNRPTIFAQESRIGRFELGVDTRDIDTSLLGNVDLILADSGRNVFQPNSDLKIFYLQDYILFTYRHPGIVDSFFADRIYMTASDAQTAEGISVGANYSEVIQVYGRPGENGYNEIVPFPIGSRQLARQDLYYVNYDTIGVGFIFAAGSNQVVGIGLYKPGS